MKLAGIGVGILALGVAFSAAAAEPWEAFLDQVRIKQAIADSLTPEQLEARKIRLAQWLYQQSLIGGNASRTPGDVCTAATLETTLGPFNDTTVGATDDFDLPADTAAPTCTAASTCTGAGPAGSLPRGAIYTGTGTGPDRAFAIRSSTACTMTITMDPATQDMALIAYQSTCSSNLADCACVDDTGVAGTAEVVTLDMQAGVDYFVVADGYTTSGPPGPSDAYTMTFSGPGCTLVGASTVNYTNTAGPLSFTGSVGVATPSQNVNVAATGGNTEALTISGCSFVGGNNADFSLSPAPSFPLSVAAGSNVDLPVVMTASAGGARTTTLTCTTPNATAPSGTSFSVTLNGTATADVSPTLTYSPVPTTSIAFPAGPAGVATSTIAITAAGAAGGGVTTVNGCTFAPAGPFTAATTPANGQFTTSVTSGSIDLTCTRGATAAASTLTCTETTGTITRGNSTTRSWPVSCPAADAAVLSASKSVTGSFNPGGAITYLITITNTGSAASADNAGDELVDVLPAQLNLVSASASAGTAVATIATRTVTWNGSVPAGGSVTITINATITNTVGQVTNQASVSYDADGNGSNETTVLSDDPGAAGGADATTFAITGALQSIPVFSNWSKLLAVFAVLGMGLMFWGFRTRQA
ncbi:hypothetical protein C7S18_15080 [Ahniella affigens]|uniref:DUF11 domain-containing protein n=1 Tax=Ahniella affigens TaxID=2021234 RepID=A0A2P1PUD1_9GAMM|nr:DUF11 domain-containing protein [Ahniella affigens]AVP98430.1 hypothetical protein C7S18_15080 [Ahniella affigens]